MCAGTTFAGGLFLCRAGLRKGWGTACLLAKKAVVIASDEIPETSRIT